MPPISVIITCFNLEHYIAEAIESVLAQDFAGPVEIIVVDDCSTDASAAAIQSFGQIRYVRTKENGGVLLATIAGLEAASGELIFFLDGDDLWEPGKLAAVVPRFSDRPTVGLVTHDLAYADSEGHPLDRPTRPGEAMAAVASDAFGATIRDGILRVADYVWLGSAFAVRRSRVQLEPFIAWARRLPDPRNTYQDWPLAYWVAALADVELDYVPAKLFRYRLHQANYSGDASTAAQATRNLRRALYSLRAMKDIARLRQLDREFETSLDERIAFSEYLIDLNCGQRARALRGLLRSANHLRRRKLLAKEMARFLAIQLVGPDRFAKLAARRSMLTNLPVS